MPVCSYLVYPSQGSKDLLKQTLNATTGCEVVPAENNDLLVLLTETANQEEEKELQEKLKQMKDIQCLALSFAHSGEGQNESS